MGHDSWEHDCASSKTHSDACSLHLPGVLGVAGAALRYQHIQPEATGVEVEPSVIGVPDAMRAGPSVLPPALRVASSAAGEADDHRC